MVRQTYRTPDFTKPPLVDAPAARFEPLPADGVLPEGFFSTSNLPTYFRLGTGWVTPQRPRMDCVVVLRGDSLETIEPRRLLKGELVAMGLAEDGSEGIYVHTEGFLGGSHSANEFRFMSTEVSRERPVNYEELAARIDEEKAHGGYLLWVAGPALVHSRARRDFEWFIRHGHVQAVLAGNAVAVHDVEAAIYGTTLGMSNAGQPTEGGHGLHMRAINKVRALGSIERAVEVGLVRSGIMHALVTHGVPYVLAGSIRDDGPLPGVFSDTLEAQDAMREHAVKATGAVLVASALHAIAVGNMLPAFHTHRDGVPTPLMTICVDQTEFVVNKLRDRGTHQAYGVVTNAQDFMHVLRSYLERRSRGPSSVAVRAEPLSSATAQELIRLLNEELSRVYPEPGATHFRLDESEVGPGQGVFLVAYLGEEAVGCGALRRIDTPTGEIKRMYVAPHARGRGIGRSLLAALEDQARSLGLARIVLETGTRQDAALGLYTRAGYVRIPCFGEYATSPLSICMGKDLTQR